MNREFHWPSREEWADRLRHPYWDGDTGCPFSDKIRHALSDYAEPDEIATLVWHLKQLYRDLGRDLRKANLHSASPKRQPGESSLAHYQRYRAAPEAEQAVIEKASELQSARGDINDVLKRIRDDKIPNRTRRSSYVPGKAGELVAPFIARYDAAWEAAREAWEQECLQTPVDDAAWEEELLWRKEIEDRERDDAAHPERFRHQV